MNAARELLERTRREQNLPATLDDDAALEQLAALLTSDERRATKKAAS
jgi:hypothetical protein